MHTLYRTVAWVAPLLQASPSLRLLALMLYRVRVCVLAPRPAVPVFKLLEKYRPETHAQKVERLKGAAETKAAGAAADDSKRPRHIKCVGRGAWGARCTVHVQAP